MNVQIRPEEAADRAAVQALIGAAFGSADRAAGEAIEVGLNDELRRDRAWIPELTLVAEQDGAHRRPGDLQFRRTGRPIGRNPAGRRRARSRCSRHGRAKASAAC